MSDAAWAAVASMVGAIALAVTGILVAKIQRASKSETPPPTPAAPVPPSATSVLSDATSFKDVAELLTADYRQREERERLASAAFRTWALRAIDILQRFIRACGFEPPDIGPQP